MMHIFFYYVCDFGRSETEKYFEWIIVEVKGLNQFVSCIFPGLHVLENEI